MLRSKFVWNWSSGSGEQDFKMLSMYFCYFHNILPLKKSMALHLDILEFPSPKDALCQGCLGLDRWFGRRKFLKMLSMYICYFVIISPWKKAWLFIWKNLNPFHPRMHLVEIGPVVLEKKIFLISSMYFRFKFS